MQFRSKYFISTSLLLFIAVNGVKATPNPELYNQPIEIRFSYDQIKMPDHMKSLGLAGIHGLIDFNQYLYGGLGVYGAVKGQSGGLFALSLDGGLQYPIIQPLWINLGANIGGGGGRSMPVGGGFFVQPHAGLSLHLKYFYLEPYYSYLKFTSGKISSNQFGIALTFPLFVTYSDPSLGGLHINSCDNNFAMSKNYLGIVGQNYFVHTGVKDTSGKVVDDNMQLAGIEFGHFIKKWFFIFAKATGAFAGRSNGYAAAVVGPGIQIPILPNDRLRINAKIGAGSGGGGGVNSGGGFILHPTLGLELRLNQFFALAADGGYLYVPQGDFKAKTAELTFKYYFANAELSSLSHESIQQNLTYRDWRIRILNETYFKPRAKNGSTDPTMQLLNANFDYFLTQKIYLTGQASFAYKGKNTLGGYFSGFVGPGLQLPLIHKLSAFGEMLFGTAGGAVLDIGTGALVKPLVGLNYQLNPYWGIQTSVGRIIAVKGGRFNSTILNVGLSCSFATLENN